MVRTDRYRHESVEHFVLSAFRDTSGTKSVLDLYPDDLKLDEPEWAGAMRSLVDSGALAGVEYVETSSTFVWTDEVKLTSWGAHRVGPAEVDRQRLPQCPTDATVIDSRMDEYTLNASGMWLQDAVVSVSYDQLLRYSPLLVCRWRI